MRNVVAMIVVFGLGVGLGMWTEGDRAEAQRSAAGVGFAAIPTAIGSEDLTGPYEVVKGWPKDISTLPGNDKWTYGAGQGVFAESPNRVFMLFRGELPKIPTPRNVAAPASGAEHQLSRSPDSGATRRRPRCPASAAPIRTRASG